MLAYSYMPRLFPRDVNIIASFWADSDTRTSGTISYGTNTNSMDLSSVANRIVKAYPDEGQSFTPTHLYIVTWDKVGYAAKHNDTVS